MNYLSLRVWIGLYLSICDRPEQKQTLDQFNEDWNKIKIFFICKDLGSLKTSDAELIQTYVKFLTLGGRRQRKRYFYIGTVIFLAPSLTLFLLPRKP